MSFRFKTGDKKAGAAKLFSYASCVNFRPLCRIFFLGLTVLLLTAMPKNAYAACSSPAGVAGEMEYNSSTNVMTYCDGTNWINFPSSGGGGKPAMVTISVGDYHSCGILSDGSAWCWGNGANGRLGNNDTADQNLPVQVGTSGTSTLWSDWVKIEAGQRDTCGIRSNGTAWCWGYYTATNTPRQVGSSGSGTLWSDWTEITVGYSHSCGIRSNGTAWCWGTGSFGEMGDNTGSGTSINTPVQVGTSGTSTLWSDWTDINAGGMDACGLRSNGTIYCWGRNPYGELGNGNGGTQYNYPVQAGSSTNWQKLGKGGANGCGIQNDGTAWCWGWGNKGALGNNGTANSDVPVQVGTSGTSTLWSDWESINMRQSHACGVRTNGTAWCWGDNFYGMLGDGGPVDSLIPVQVVGPAGSTSSWTDWNNIDVGYYHSCGIRDNGSAWCWGYDANGQLGTGGNIWSHVYAPLKVGLEGFAVLSGGGGGAGQKGVSGTYTLSYNQTFDTGESSIVCVATLDNVVTGVQWNSQNYTLEAQNTGSNGVNTYLYSLHNITGAQSNLTITLSASTTIAATKPEFTGLSLSSLDKTASAAGSSSTPDSGLTATTSQAEELLVGCVGVNGPNDDNRGTWDSLSDVGGFGTTGQGATSNAYVRMAWGLVQDAGTYKAAKSGMDSRDWNAIIATYKIDAITGTGYGEGGAGCSTAGQLYYDFTNDVIVYCNGSTLNDAGPNPGTGGAGCTTPTASAGAMQYDSTADALTYCDGASWVSIGK